MSNEELVILIQGGDHDKLLELWRQVKGFVIKQAKRWPETAACELEDMIQSGYLALMYAVDNYVPETDSSFVNFLSLCLKTAFSDAQGKRSRRQQLDPIHAAVSIDTPLGEDEDAGILADILEAPDALKPFQEAEESLWREQLHKAIEAALCKLRDDERAVIRGHYYEGQSFQSLGGQSARTIHNYALVKLRANKDLQQYIEDLTPYYKHVGLSAFQRTGDSAVDLVVFERERLEKITKSNAITRE